MSTVSNWVKQLAKALEFANQVGNPTALPNLLAKQSIAAMNEKQHFAVIENTSNSIEVADVNASAQTAYLACAR